MFTILISIIIVIIILLVLAFSSIGLAYLITYMVDAAEMNSAIIAASILVIGTLYLIGTLIKNSRQMDMFDNWQIFEGNMDMSEEDDEPYVSNKKQRRKKRK